MNKGHVSIMVDKGGEFKVTLKQLAFQLAAQT